MKVAICLSGIPRHLRPKNFLERIASWYETTLFVNYWEHEPNIINHQFNGGGSGKVPVVFHHRQVKSPLYESYFTKQIFSEMIPTFQKIKDKIRPECQDRHDLGVFGMMYSILKSHEMRVAYENEHNMQFDCVIRCRFESGFRFDEGDRSILDLYAYDLRHIYTPDINVNVNCGMNDQLAFGNRDVMAIYMTMYNRIIPLSNRFRHSPEWMAHFNIEGIKRYAQAVIG